jgi:UDP-GlcNAc3NAcA epimerase
MKVLTIIGARPQFIKAGIVSLKMRDYPAIKEVLVHTGQHFDDNMSDIFFRQMKIPKPKYNLSINNLGHGAMTGRMLESLEEILLKEKPDCCIVYGDTNSTLAGALAAKKLHIPVLHIEAGLRSFNMNMPEEINRILTDRISNILFCPTTTAVNNLEKEGFNQFNCNIYKSGDVMEDAALHFSKQTNSSDKKLLLPEKPYILATIHRAENTDIPERLNGIISALNQLSKKCQIVLPLHPRTKKILLNSKIELNFPTIEPVGYLEILQLIKGASLVLTDSGGLQKEAFFFKKYCITLRDETEWTELVENGYNFVAGYNSVLILELFQLYFGKEIHEPINLYGNGTAADFICRTIKEMVF